MTEMTKTSEKVDKKCDFLSDEFDPLTALCAKDPSIVPNPEVAAFNNLAEYSNVVRGLSAEQRKKAGSKTIAKDSDKPQRQWKRIVKSELLPSSETDASDTDIAQSILVKGKHKQLQKDVFKGMEALSLQTGPLSILHTALKERIQVKVWTRSAKQLRGFSVGFIVAFDKHWNLAMVDVDETYCRPCLPRTSFTLPRHMLMEMKREGAVNPGSSSRPSTPDPCKPQPETGASVEASGRTSKIDHTRTKEHSLSSDKEPRQTCDERTFVVPGSKGYGAPEESRVQAQFPRGVELKEKIPGLSGRVFVRHLNQVFIRGDNIAVVQLVR